MNAFVFIVLGLTTLKQASSFVAPSKDTAVDHGHQTPDNFRKQFNNYKRFEVRQRADDDEDKGEIPARKEETKAKDIDSIVIAIDTGGKPAANNKEDKVDILDKIEQTIKELAKPNNNPLMRARNDYNIKPELIQFRSRHPSLKFDLNSKTIMKAVNSFLSSPALRRYADKFAHSAAVIYKVISNEIRRNMKE